MSPPSGGWTWSHTLKSVGATAGVMLIAWFSADLCLPLQASCFMAILPLAWMTWTEKYKAWPGYLYFFVLALFMFREFAIMLRHVIPCGVCTYKSSCLEMTNSTARNATVCQSWGFQLNGTNGTVADSCKSTANDMDWGSMWMGVPPAILALGTLAVVLYRWHGLPDDHVVKVQVTVILFLPATYVVCSLYSLRLLTINRSDLWTPKAVFDIGDLYTAVCLFAFEQLATKVVEEKRKTELANLKNATGPGLKNFQSLGDSLMKLGCYPYVICCFASNGMEIVIKEFVDFWYPKFCEDHLAWVVNLYFPSLVGFELEPPKYFSAFLGHPGSYACEQAWGAVEQPFEAMNFLVCSIAVTCIVIYEHEMGHSLHAIQPKLKFFAVKGLLLVIFWQGIILSVLVPRDAWKKSRVNSFCLIWEAFCLGVLQLKAYVPSDFQVIDEMARVEENEKSSRSFGQAGFQAVKDGLTNVRDLTTTLLPRLNDSSSGAQPGNGGSTGGELAKSVDFENQDADAPPPNRGCEGDSCVTS